MLQRIREEKPQHSCGHVAEELGLNYEDVMVYQGDTR
jgi:hypothetical protein